MHVSWSGFDGASDADAEVAEFMVNGTPVGRGSQGFKAVLTELRRLDSGSVVYIYPGPRDDWRTYELATGPKGTLYWWMESVVPYKRFPDLERELFDIARTRCLQVWCLARAPIELESIPKLPLDESKW